MLPIITFANTVHLLTEDCRQQITLLSVETAMCSETSELTLMLAPAVPVRPNCKRLALTVGSDGAIVLATLFR